MKSWVDNLREKYQSSVAHTFILHGNVHDYVEENKALREYLAGEVFDKRNMIIFYDRSKGISFYSPEMRSNFLELIDVNMNTPQQAAIREFQAHNKKMLKENPRAGFAREAGAALPLIEAALLHPDLQGQIMVFVEYPELIWAEGDYAHMSETDRLSLATILRWANEPEFGAAANPVILCARVLTDLHSSLRAASNKLEAVEVPYPTTDERRAYIEYLLATHDNIELADGMSVDGLAALTGGLSRILIEDIFLRALQAKSPLNIELVKERKDTIVQSEFSGILEIIDPDFGFEAVGGLDHVKDYLRKNVINPMRGRARKQRASRGVLFTGPPGTGKTLAAIALAKEAQVNCVKLNIGRLLNAYVGTSERNLELALSCIRSLKPTIVFIDEIDQQLQRGSGGDSGVSRRIFARILDAMSTDELGERGEVCWIAATNRIGSVDSALRRQGRFDKIIPFLPGDARERMNIIKAVLEKNQVGFKGTQEEWGRIAVETEGHTGSDLEGLCIKSMELAEDDDHSQTITAENFFYALQVIPPSTPPEEMFSMIEESIRYSNDLTLLPDGLRDKAIEAAGRNKDKATEKNVMRGPRETA